MINDALEQLIFNSAINKKPAYTTGEAALILSVSKNTIILLCDEWTLTTLSGLESYRVGTHRRIPHHSLAEWVNINKQVL